MVCQDVLLLLSAFLLSMLQQMVQLWPTEFKGFCLSKVIWLKYFPLSCAVTSLASITGGGGGEACKWQELVWYCTQPVFLQQCKARYCSDARAIVTMQMQCQYNVSDNTSGKNCSDIVDKQCSCDSQHARDSLGNQTFSPICERPLDPLLQIWTTASFVPEIFQSSRLILPILGIHSVDRKSRFGPPTKMASKDGIN